jgi:hypothetical protein
MKATSLGLFAVVLLVPACSGFFSTGARNSAEIASKKPAHAKIAAHEASEPKPQRDDTDFGSGFDAEAERAARPTLAIGDYFVERFSGSFRKTPLTLTEEVIAAEGDLLVIDFKLAETGNPKVQHLRTRYNPATRSVEQVSVISGDREIPAPIATYDRMIERTSFAADSNKGLINSQEQTCLVGGREIACRTSDYQVSVGEREATLSITKSDSVTGRDVAGQIVTGDGNVVYRAELVEMRQGGDTDSIAALLTPRADDAAK